MIVTYDKIEGDYPHVFQITNIGQSFLMVIDWCFAHLERKNLDRDWRWDYDRKAVMIADDADALRFWMRFGGM